MCFTDDVKRLTMDNRQPPEWPMRRVRRVIAVTVHVDEEPLAERLTLSCGHWVVNTYGKVNHQRFKPGDRLRCRTCALGRYRWESVGKK